MAAQPVLLVLGRVRRLQLIFLRILNRHAAEPDADVNFTRGDPTQAAVYQTDFVIENWEAKSRKLNDIQADPNESDNVASPQCSAKVVVAPSLDCFKIDDYKQVLAGIYSEHHVSHFCLVRSDGPGRVRPDEIVVVNDLIQFITSRFPTVHGTAVYIDEDTLPELQNPADGPPCLRGLANMFLFATEPMAARPRYAQERMVANFLSTLSLAVVPSEVPKRNRLPPIVLGNAFRTLFGVLEPLLSYSRELLEETQGQWSTSQTLVDELQKELGDVATALTSKQEKLADLDTEALELLKDESFKQRFYIRPKDFKIHLTTEYPIRNVKEAIGDDSKQHSSSHAGNEYHGIVSNAAFKMGFARVELFGWRKEVYGAEILDLRSIVGILESDKDDATARLSALKLEVASKENRAAILLKTLETMEADLQALRQPYGRHWEYVAAKPQLTLGSLTSVTQLLGLETAIPRSYPIYASGSTESPVSPYPKPEEQVAFAAAVEHTVEALSEGLLRALPALSLSIRKIKVSLYATIEELRALDVIEIPTAMREPTSSEFEKCPESKLKTEAKGAVESVRIQLEQLQQKIVIPQRERLGAVMVRAIATANEVDHQIRDIDLRFLAVQDLLEYLRGNEDVSLGLATDLISQRCPLKTIQSLLLAKQHQLALENGGKSQVNDSECSAEDDIWLNSFGSWGKIEEDVKRPRQEGSTLHELLPRTSSNNATGNTNPVRVIVLGKTQAGKSSVLKALLEYGEHKELAAQVVTGRADVSITDNVSNYAASIPIRKHVCARKTGEIVEEADFQKMKDIAKRKLVYKNDLSASWTVNLNLIDTPGLGDSRNMAEHMRRTDQLSPPRSGEQSQARPAEYVANSVDERHKLSIVAALNKESSINAVCLIINSQDSLSGSVSAYLNQYVKLFQKTNVEYVVIHTAVDYSKISGEDMEQRKLHVDELLGIRGSHHVIQTKVNTERAYEAHALNLSIAGILSTFRMSEPRSLGALAYPKENLHNNMDDTIRTVYDKYLNRLKVELVTKETEIKAIESTGESSRLNAKSREIDRQIRVLQVRLTNLDTSEEIWMDGKEGYEPYHSFLPVHSTISFSFLVDHPIRRAKETHEQYGSWYGLSGCEGERSLSCRWEARSDCYARAEIHLYTHKRDVHAVDISGIRDQLSGRRAEKANVQRELEDIAGKIKALKDSGEECLVLAREAVADRSKMDVTEYSPTAFPKTWFLFCGCDILCSSFGYQLGLGLPDEMFGDVKDLFVGWKEALEDEEKEQDTRAEVCKLVVSSIGECITTLAALQTAMSSKIEQYDRVVESVNRRLAQTEVVTHPDRDVLVQSLLDHMQDRLDLSASTTRLQPRSDIRQMMTEEVEATCQLVDNLSNTYELTKQCLSEETDNLCETSEAIDALLAQMQTICGKWKASESHHFFRAAASAAAKRLITGSIQEKLLPIGAWTILNRAIEARRMLASEQKNSVSSGNGEADGDVEQAAKGHIILSLVRALAVFGEVTALYHSGQQDPEADSSGNDNFSRPPMSSPGSVRCDSLSLGPLDMVSRCMAEPLFGGLPRRSAPVNILETPKIVKRRAGWDRPARSPAAWPNRYVEEILRGRHP
ncbi:hypothetical protein MMC26_005802 [Xylographa opegraphella]|nr:hypothetical protein [Xylographa opegraphella]